MKGVTFNIKANPVYPSENEIDFIMCFRYTTGTTLKYSEASTLATTSLINV